MNEKPLERLNYFNGQRLQAGDFKLEQDYHMRVRRWLNPLALHARHCDGAGGVCGAERSPSSRRAGLGN
jgi:hypothetical protein